eukprot:CFRG3339T1
MIEGSLRDENAFVYSQVTSTRDSELIENEVLNTDRQIERLHTAVVDDDPVTILKLVEEGLSVNTRNTNGLTPLYVAATSGNVRLVELLCRVNADLDISCTENEETALHSAARAGLIQVVEVLLDNGAQVLTLNKSGGKAITSATSKDVCEYLRWWEEECALDYNFARTRNQEGLVASCRHWVIDRAKSTISYALSSSISTLPSLPTIPAIERVVSSVPGMGWWPMSGPLYYEDEMWATLGSIPEDTTITALISTCTNTSTQTLKPSFTSAASSEHASTFALKSVSPIPLSSLQRKRGIRDLSQAITSNSVDSLSIIHDQIAKASLLLGCDVDNIFTMDKCRSDGSNALHIAATIDADQLLECLLEKSKKGYVNVARKDGLTPLHVAAYKGSAQCCSRLLLHDASVVACDTARRTALMIASERGHIAVVEMLLRHGANPNAFDKNGNTSVHVAAVNGHVEVLHVLGDQGTDMNIMNNYRKTPLDCAIALSQADICDILQKVYGGVRCKDLIIKQGKGRVMGTIDYIACVAYEAMVPDTLKHVLTLSQTLGRGERRQTDGQRSKFGNNNVVDAIALSDARWVRVWGSTKGVLAVGIAAGVSIITVSVSMFGISVVAASLLGGLKAGPWVTVCVMLVTVCLGGPLLLILLRMLFRLMHVSEDDENR